MRTFVAELFSKLLAHAVAEAGAIGLAKAGITLEPIVALLIFAAALFVRSRWSGKE